MVTSFIIKMFTLFSSRALGLIFFSVCLHSSDPDIVLSLPLTIHGNSHGYPLLKTTSSLT